MNSLNSQRIEVGHPTEKFSKIMLNFIKILKFALTSGDIAQW